MRNAFRKLVFAFPFGCLVAIATHFVRFGDEHAFGGGANEALVSAAVSGSIATALTVLHAFVRGGSTLMTGTLAANRMRALLPSFATVFALAALVYHGIELLEGSAFEVGWPTVVLAALSIALAYALRRLAAFVARQVAHIIRDWLALLDRRERLAWRLNRQPQLAPAQSAHCARCFGRAPPNGRRFR